MTTLLHLLVPLRCSLHRTTILIYSILLRLHRHWNSFRGTVIRCLRLLLFCPKFQMVTREQYNFILLEYLLFNVYMDGCKREMKARVGNVGVRLQEGEREWSLMASLFVDDTAEVSTVL